MSRQSFYYRNFVAFSVSLSELHQRTHMTKREVYTRRRSGETRKHDRRKRTTVEINTKEFCDACDKWLAQSNPGNGADEDEQMMREMDNNEGQYDE